MPSLTLKPTYPIPGEAVEVTFSGLNSASNFVALYPTAAPEKSAIYMRLKESTKSRVKEHSGDSNVKWRFVPDVGGVYTFDLEEFTNVPPSLGTHAGDTRGATSPTINATTSVTLRVGQKMTQKIGTANDNATLEVFVWADTIRPTTLEVHGVATPRLTAPTSEAAAAAIEDSDVVEAVEVLANKSAGTIIGSIASIYEDLRDAYQGHIVNATHHNAADTHNTIGDGFVATSPKAAENAINELYRQFESHQQNNVESGGTIPHNAVDGINPLVTGGASADPTTQIAALVDLWIAYSDHIATASPVHNSADVTNTAPSLSLLMTVHRRFFEALASQSPAPPAATNEAVTTLAQLAGFSEA